MDGYLILLVIAIVFLPGILWENIDSKFRTGSMSTFVFFIANSFVFGVVSYTVLIIILMFIFKIFGIEFGDIFSLVETMHPYVDIMHPYIVINPSLLAGILFVVSLIVCALVITPILAIAWLGIKKLEVLSKIFKYITRRKDTKSIDSWVNFDIWSYYQEQDTPDYMVRICDFEKKQIYVGYVEATSEKSQSRDIILKNVIIENFENSNMKNIDSNKIRDYLYISLPLEKFSMEYIKINYEENSDDSNL